MNTIISCIKQYRATTIPLYKALHPRKTKGTFIFNTGDMLLEGFYQLIYNTSHLFILAFKQNVTPIKCPVDNSAAHKDREGDRWKMIAVLFLFFFFFYIPERWAHG